MECIPSAVSRCGVCDATFDDGSKVMSLAPSRRFVKDVAAKM